MGDKPLISVVIPVYNVQNWLRPCLDSVCGQSYGNLDVILVDDGSQDHSADICREFCEKDARFHLIQQENAGLGAARNRGLNSARGTYICFIDSDDCIHPDYVRLLYENLVRYQADISICGYQMIGDEVPDFSVGPDMESENQVQVMDRVELLKRLLTDKTSEIMVAWNKMVSREWLGGFQFENKWHEDEFMINEYIRRCSSAILSSARLYCYRYRPDSIMGEKNKKDFRHLDRLEAREQRIQYFYVPEYKKVRKDLLLNYLKNRVALFTNLADQENAKMLKKKIYPRFLWGLWHYLLAGGFFRKNSFGMHLLIFFVSPMFYKRLSDSRNI